jgi:hypothetical protein
MNTSMPAQHIGDPRTPRICGKLDLGKRLQGSHSSTLARETRFGETSRINMATPVQHIGDSKSPRMPGKLDSGNVTDEHFEACTAHWGPQKPQETRFGETSRMNTANAVQHIEDSRTPRMPGKLDSGKRPGSTLRGPHITLGAQKTQECMENSIWGNVPDRSPHNTLGTPKAQECPGNSLLENVPDEYFEARTAHWGHQKPKNAREIRFGETSRTNTSKPTQHIGDHRSLRMPGKLDSGKHPG